MWRTVRTTVWIAWILFDRFSMMVKPERPACEKYAANGFGWVFAGWKRNGQRGRTPNDPQPFRRIFVVKKIRMYRPRDENRDNFRDEGSAWTTGYGEQSRSFLWFFDCKNRDLANGWLDSRKTSGFVFGIVRCPMDKPLLQRYAHAAFVWKRPVLTFIGKLNMNFILIWKMIFSLI